MQTLDSTLKFRERLFGLGMKTKLEAGKAPTPFIPEAQSMAEKYAKKINGVNQ